LRARNASAISYARRLLGEVIVMPTRSGVSCGMGSSSSSTMRTRNRSGVSAATSGSEHGVIPVLRPSSLFMPMFEPGALIRISGFTRMSSGLPLDGFSIA